MANAEAANIEQIVIERLGAQGDGVVSGSNGQRFVPYTLPGESILASFQGERGRLHSVCTASADRIEPVCRHFGQCGGCSLQHYAVKSYAEWKRELVVSAFNARGIAADVLPLSRAEGKRRRAVLSARRTGSHIAIGFHEAQSHHLVEIVECPVLEPRIVAALPGLKQLVEPLTSRRGEVRLIVTLTDSGLDIALSGSERVLTSELRAKLAHVAAEVGAARVSNDGEPIYEALKPHLKFGSVEAMLPPGAFVQAMASAEVAMSAAIVAGVGKAKKVADLFSGAGAFSFPLAARAHVLAIDGDGRAVAALQAAAKQATGLKPITARQRDLFREPLSALELNDFDAIVFDPPRAGAEAQSRAIAKSKVKSVVAVSCNPATLARDARILIDGGYAMKSVTPIDQFHYSPHVEAVAVFTR